MPTSAWERLFECLSGKDFETLETRFTGVWAPYYTLHKILQGLLDAYVKTGNRKAYGMVEALAGMWKAGCRSFLRNVSRG